MPLDELTALGYDVGAPPEGQEHMPTVINGFGTHWILTPGGDEAAVVQEAKNHKALHDKLEAAQGYFADNYANWAAMTAQQKDTAARNAQRALANLIRHVRNDLTSEGE